MSIVETACYTKWNKKNRIVFYVGLSALEVSRDTKMRQLLDVQPLQSVQKTVQRFEGYIMKVRHLFIMTLAHIHLLYLLYLFLM